MPRIRNIHGQFVKAPGPRFADGEFVTTSAKHYSSHNIVMLSDPTYNKTRGWIYVQNFANLQAVGGGCSFWENEDSFEPINNPVVKLYAERIKLKKEIQKHEQLLKQKKEELTKIEYALFVSVPEWDKVKKACKCGHLFICNSHNVNADMCDDCYQNQMEG